MRKMCRYLFYTAVCTFGIIILIWLIRNIREEANHYEWLGDIREKAAEQQMRSARLAGDSATDAPPPESKVKPKGN